MKKLFFTFLILSINAYGQDFSFRYAEGTLSSDKKILDKAMNEVLELLPLKMKRSMPKNLEIKVAKLSASATIPEDICLPEQKKKPFIYGAYEQRGNRLTINKAVMSELLLGKENSKRINCQHKSLYDQAIATIIHELTHAYDLRNGKVSHSTEFIRRAGFKKQQEQIENKNVEAMRSADAYELVNIVESFAVNMEYFTMDSEFACRKPSMFDFYKRHFEVDPFPNRDCKINDVVMKSTLAGFMPTKLENARVYRIDYLMASPGSELSSGFGHSMFRLVVCAPEHYDPLTKKTIPATPFGKKCLDDKVYHLVVSYRANVEDATLNYMKGLTGGYPSMLYILNFSDVLDEYNRDELRDVVAYPLRLTDKERSDFLTKVKEEHWNYRGSYKFINNNCAVESYDLLKSISDKEELDNKSSVSPKGVLEDLDHLDFLSIKNNQDIENYPAKTEQVILALGQAYGYRNVNKKAVLKFIETSKVSERLAKFQEFTKTTIPAAELNAQVHALKERLVKAAAFSVIEQQIQRATALKTRKLVSELLMNTKDEGIQKLSEETRALLTESFTDLSKDGYGIPLVHELAPVRDFENKNAETKELTDRVEGVIKELIPNEYRTLEEIIENTKKFNKYSLELRKEYRKNFDLYVNTVLKNLARSDYTRVILVSASEGNKESLLKVRELIGKDLVTEKEILDNKLKLLITEAL